MKFDFDKPTDRRATDSVKWQVRENELPMWIADMDFETAPAIKRAVMKVAEHGIYGYMTTPDEFFCAMSDFWYKRFGFCFDSRDTVYCSGIVAAISSMVRKLTTPAENVLIQPPVYNIFYNCILNSGRNVLCNNLIVRDGEYDMDFEDLEEKLSNPQTSLMILCNPHNPIGKIWPRETLERVGALCKKYGVTVISDEIHCAITMPGTKYIPFASVNDVCADISVSCIAHSKTFNLAGLQSACLVAKNPILRHRVWRGVNTDDVGEPNAFSMRANIAACREGEEWLNEMLEYVFENKRVAVEYIEKNIPGLKANLSHATYLLWVDVSTYTKDSESFAEDLREKTGLYVAAGREYGESGEGFLRINLATQRKNVLDGMKRLESYVKNYCIG